MWTRILKRMSRLTAGGRVTDVEAQILLAIASEFSLRSYRNLEGEKTYQLCDLGGNCQPVERTVVLGLRRKRLVETNHKFPSATFLLTERGSRVVEALGWYAGGVSAREFVRD